MSRKVSSFEVEVLDRPYDQFGVRKLSRTAVIRHVDSHRNVFREETLGVMPADDIYEQISRGNPLVLDGLYIRDFSLSAYRKKHNLAEIAQVELHEFSAAGAFFDAGSATDFSYALFRGAKCSFRESTFNNGTLSFYHAQFEGCGVEFEGAFFNAEEADFQYAGFGDAKLDFDGARFGHCDVSFVSANFGRGRFTCRNVDFGSGSVEFHYSVFGDGDVLFERSRFRGEKTDFRKVEFGAGKVNFSRCDFGAAATTFEGSEFGAGKVLFRRSRFEGNVSFQLVSFGEGGVAFDQSHFVQGSISLLKASGSSVSFHSCQFDAYADLRLEESASLDLSHAVVRNIINLKAGASGMRLQRLYLVGLLNLGRIAIGWKANGVRQLIGGQEETSYSEKAEQFRLLKEDFYSAGQYDDEDLAYVEFKRCEQKAERQEVLASGRWKAAYYLPFHWSRKLLFDTVGLYATAPVRVLFSMVVVYVLFSFAFAVLPEFAHADIVSSVGDPDRLSVLKKSFYHSAITFLTIGYGDFYPSGHTRWLSALEGWVGLFLMSYFTVAFVRKILR